LTKATGRPKTERIEESDLPPPHIDPVPVGIERPLWSVMIPTYNCAKYLRQTLESVLAQDPGSDHMQIEVVDDYSTDNPENVVGDIGLDRIDFHRKPSNEGVTANFNTCIQRSRGYLVHILHGDDYVLPNFYSQMAKAAEECPNTSFIYSRALVIDADGQMETVSARIKGLEEESHNVGDLFYANHFRAPGVVIRRSFYEKHGGFRQELSHVTDWEMWVRAIALGGGVSINHIYSAYRDHAANETNSLMRSAENLRDCLRLGSLWNDLKLRDFDFARFRQHFAWIAAVQMRRFKNSGDGQAYAANAALWKELTPFSRRAMVAAKSILKRMC
jgi:glycosyltransferase involved in cell wall biosynthesis